MTPGAARAERHRTQRHRSPRTGVDEVLAGLDHDQRAACRAVRGPVCILAGAGTGKTRTITHRIAYRVLHRASPRPQHVLAVTFTARAAGEMRARLARPRRRRRAGPHLPRRRAAPAALLRAAACSAAAMPELVENKPRLVAPAAARAGLPARPHRPARPGRARSSGPRPP